MDENLISESMIQAIERGVFPGAVLLVAQNGKKVFHGAFGYANLFLKQKMQPDSIFDLASLTKPLATALAIARLAESYPDLITSPVGRILNAFSGTDKAFITVDMLLRHTSGFPAHEKYYEKLTRGEKAIQEKQTRLLAGQVLENKIGTKEVYSDLGFMVLRKIVESLSGMALDQFVKKEIYRPLGIDRLFFIPEATRQQVKDEFGPLLVATQHCPWRNRLLVGEVDDENAWVLGGVDGHAGLFGDADSILALCLTLLDLMKKKTHPLIDLRIFQQLIQKKKGRMKVAGFDIPSKVDSSAGRYFSDQSIGHLGFTGTSFWIDPAGSIVVILLTNRIHPDRSNADIRKFRPQIHDLVREQLA